jgi:hypothetical protein
MNPTQMLMTQLQNQLKMRNPQMFQQFQSLRENNGNPNEMINSIINKYTPEQKANFIKYANGFGITNEQLNEFGINSK